jgi:hypothetical protein
MVSPGTTEVGGALQANRPPSASVLRPGSFGCNASGGDEALTGRLNATATGPRFVGAVVVPAAGIQRLA